jgi:GrpB-like predicted nucleotidyltransferase (UPF0157 family)
VIAPLLLRPQRRLRGAHPRTGLVQAPRLRDWLRITTAARELYQRTKQDLARAYGGVRAKTPVLDEIITRAGGMPRG